VVTRERERVLELVTHDPVHSLTRPLAVVSSQVLELVTHDPVHLPSKPQVEGSERQQGDDATDPLGGHTPEVAAALAEATAAIQSSASLREAAAKLLAAADDMLKTVMNAVNSGITKKIAETNDLKVYQLRYKQLLTNLPK